MPSTFLNTIFFRPNLEVGLLALFYRWWEETAERLWIKGMSYTFVQPGLNLCLYDSRVYAVTTTDFPVWRLYNLWIISAPFLIKWWLLLILSKSIVQISFRQSYQTVYKFSPTSYIWLAKDIINGPKLWVFPGFPNF